MGTVWNRQQEQEEAEDKNCLLGRTGIRSVSDDYESTVENSRDYWCQKVYQPGTGTVFEQYWRYKPSQYEPVQESALAGHVVITENPGYQYLYKPANPTKPEEKARFIPQSIRNKTSQ